MTIQTLFKVSGRSVDGTATTRFILIDTDDVEVGRNLIQQFKEGGGQDPDGFVEWVNRATPYTGERVNQPVVSHALEHGQTEEQR